MPACRAIILANGDEPRAAAARRLDELFAEREKIATFVIALDRDDPRADFVVGDGDSLTEEEKSALGDRFVRVNEQETNDLAKGYRFAVARGASEIFFFGATGKREDHAIGNIFHLLEFETESVRVAMISDYGEFTVVRAGETRRYLAEPGRAFSVFAPLPGTRVESTGLEWPLAGADLSRLWSGTLNRATTDEVTLRATAPILVYSAR